MERAIAERWQAILDVLRKDLTLTQFETWFDVSKVKPASIDDGVLHLDVPNRYFKAVLSENYRPKIVRAAEKIMGMEPRLEISVSGELYRALRSQQQEEVLLPLAPEQVRKPAVSSQSALNLLFSWDSFVVGHGNRLAHSALATVAESPGGVYNPVLIHGGHGLGKTHLLQAVTAVIREKHPEVNIAFMPSETFVNEYVGAVPSKSLPAFRKKMRSLDVLVVDDFHFFLGKHKTLQEFRHTFDTLQSMGKQIVLSSLVPPGDMEGLPAALKGRLMSGLMIRLEPPGPDLRMDLVRAKAARIRVQLPEAVATYLAGHVSGSVREIEGAVAKVCAMALSDGRVPDVPLARKALAELQSLRQEPVSLSEIADAVADYFRLDPSALRGRSRIRSIAVPRHVAMYLAKEFNGYSLTEIGQFFGGRNHSTVLYATARIAADLAENHQLKQIISKIRSSLGR
ncbi:MAG: chromosomal replication initiator protein DnaA [Planctomycetes bacterium]|nr:chromosomal replication initiator protein DnaA [Planctomycetota bacterium]